MHLTEGLFYIPSLILLSSSDMTLWALAGFKTWSRALVKLSGNNRAVSRPDWLSGLPAVTRGYSGRALLVGHLDRTTSNGSVIQETGLK